MPAPDKLKLVLDVDPVVFPTADQPSVCTDCAAVVAPDKTIVLPEYPTEIPPAPEREKLELKLVELVDAVVLPTALHP